jgi:large subunit ribosomal protein L30
MLKQLIGYTYEELADALLAGKVRLKDLKELEPNFRLTPPSKGFKNVKEKWPAGNLGYMQKEINELLKRMI